jgi:hypothetical protein
MAFCAAWGKDLPHRLLSSIMATPEDTFQTATESYDGTFAQVPGLSAVKGPMSNECKDSCPHFLSYAIRIKDADGVCIPPLHSLYSAHISLNPQHHIHCKIFVFESNEIKSLHKTTHCTTPHRPKPHCTILCPTQHNTIQYMTNCFPDIRNSLETDARDGDPAVCQVSV